MCTLATRNGGQTAVLLIVCQMRNLADGVYCVNYSYSLRWVCYEACLLFAELRDCRVYCPISGDGVKINCHQDAFSMCSMSVTDREKKGKRKRGYCQTSPKEMQYLNLMSFCKALVAHL